MQGYILNIPKFKIILQKIDWSKWLYMYLIVLIDLDITCVLKSRSLEYKHDKDSQITINITGQNIDISILTL